MADLEKEIENLKRQQEQARELFIQYQGAIQFAQSLIEKEKESKKDAKK